MSTHSQHEALARCVFINTFDVAPRYYTAPLWMIGVPTMASSRAPVVLSIGKPLGIGHTARKASRLAETNSFHATGRYSVTAMSGRVQKRRNGPIRYMCALSRGDGCLRFSSTIWNN